MTVQSVTLTDSPSSLTPSNFVSYSAVEIFRQDPVIPSSKSDMYTGTSCDGKNVICFNK